MKRCGLLLGLVVISALLVATPALAYRTVSPPPPWLASNAHEMMSRAASALGVDYNYGFEAWDPQIGSAYEGPDCSGFVQKVWEVPDTLWYREEDGNFPGVTWDQNINWNNLRYTAQSFYSAGNYWSQPSYASRTRGDAASTGQHVVLIHKPNYPVGYDTVFHSPNTGDVVKRETRNTSGCHIARRNYLEASSENVHVLDNTTAGMSGPETVFRWHVSTSNQPWQGESYQFVYGNEEAHARWVPWFEVYGTYRVYARYSTAASRTTDAVYQVHHYNGQTNVSVNQRQNDGQDGWKFLGYFVFNAGWNKYSGAVDLYSPTSDGGNLVADALRFELAW